MAEPAALLPGRRIPGHQRLPVPAAQAAGWRLAPARAGFHRGGRRRPGHLRLARRHAGQFARAADRFPRPQGDQAGAELPLHCAHPGSGQRGHRQQSQALRQEAVERARHGRSHRHPSDERRGARGRVGGVPPVGAQVRAPRAVPRLRHPVPGQPPGAAVRADPAARAHPLCAVGRPELLRQGRDQGHLRLPAPDRQSRRRSCFYPRDHHAAPRRRQHHARSAGHVRRAGQGVVVRSGDDGRHRGQAAAAPAGAAARVLRVDGAAGRPRGQGPGHRSA
ncbi:hypothetical protein D9M72_453720 [compost metagenome]